MMRLRDFTPAAMQHLAGYCELAKAAADEWRRDSLRRVVFALAAFTVGGVALLYGCGWALLSAWDSPARNWVATATLSGLGIACAGLVFAAARRRSMMPATALLLAELQQDRQLLLELQSRTVA